MVKKTLITGASGFIGACLARRLVKKRSEVHVFLRQKSKSWRLDGVLDRLFIHNVDLTDRESVKKAVREIEPGTIYHLAAYGGYRKQIDVKRIVETNLTGTINIIDACAAVGVDIFVNAGTSSEYGVKRKPMQETDSLEPNSVYGVTKAAATLYCTHMARDNGFPAVTFRIFAAYGPYEEPGRLIPSVVNAFLRDESPRLSSPDSVRDFIFVEDILDAFEKATKEKKACGKVLNLGTGVQHTIGEVVEIVRELANCKKDAVWGAVEKGRFEPKSWVADMSKTQRILKWKPKYDLKKGLTKTVGWFRENMVYYRE